MNIGFGSITYFDTYKKIDFWPDKKSFINRGLKKILKNKDRKLFEKIREGTATPVVISFNSSERLLFKTNDSVIKDSYACNLLLEQANYFKKRAFDVLKIGNHQMVIEISFCLTIYLTKSTYLFNRGTL